MPVIILNILAYLIGYSLTRSLSGTLLIAVLFTITVFSMNFDDKVKNAIKHSYIFATYVLLVYFIFDIFESFISMFYSGRLPSLSSYPDGYFGLGFIPRALTFLYTYGMIIVDSQYNSLHRHRSILKHLSKRHLGHVQIAEL